LPLRRQVSVRALRLECFIPDDRRVHVPKWLRVDLQEAGFDRRSERSKLPKVSESRKCRRPVFQVAGRRTSGPVKPLPPPVAGSLISVSGQRLCPPGVASQVMPSLQESTVGWCNPIRTAIMAGEFHASSNAMVGFRCRSASRNVTIGRSTGQPGHGGSMPQPSRDWGDEFGKVVLIVLTHGGVSVWIK